MLELLKVAIPLLIVVGASYYLGYTARRADDLFDRETFENQARVIRDLSRQLAEKENPDAAHYDADY